MKKIWVDTDLDVDDVTDLLSEAKRKMGLAGTTENAKSLLEMVDRQYLIDV